MMRSGASLPLLTLTCVVFTALGLASPALFERSMASAVHHLHVQARRNHASLQIHYVFTHQAVEYRGVSTWGFSGKDLEDAKQKRQAFQARLQAQPTIEIEFLKAMPDWNAAARSSNTRRFQYAFSGVGLWAGTWALALVGLGFWRAGRSLIRQAA
jgi:hypothetical protein